MGYEPGSDERTCRAKRRGIAHVVRPIKKKGKPIKKEVRPIKELSKMAVVNLRRLASQISRNPSLSHSFRATIARSSASSVTSSTPTSSAKVSDRIVNLFAIDPDGHKRGVIGLSGQTLLKALTNHGLIDPASHRLEEIDACSAECEVVLTPELQGMVVAVPEPKPWDIP
nr:ferredoxin-2, mitochondrial [Ipomoea batatas]